MTKALKDYTTQELFNELYGRSDVVAIKLWTEQDVKKRFDELLDEHFPELQESAAAIEEYVLNGDYSYLSECTEADWEVIDQEILNIIQWFKENKND